MRARLRSVSAAVLLVALAAACEFALFGPGVSGPCPDGPLFSVPLLPLPEINHIVPLGNLNPPDHTLPTEHTYWNVHVPGARRVDVTAPGDVVVTRIERVQHPSGSTDYGLEFAVCNAVVGRLAHLSGLSPELDGEVVGGGSCGSYPGPGGTVTTCEFSVRRRVTAGARLGWGGDRNYVAGIDFGLTDERVTRLILGDRTRYVEHSVCPVDYYVPSVRVLLEAKFGDPVSARTTPPLCGEFAFDAPGTAQGNWFQVGGTGFFESYAIALVRDNVLPSSRAMSIGTIGTAYDGAVLFFAEAGAGQVRRAFDQVTAAGGVYCYDGLHLNPTLASGSAITGRIALVQVEPDGRMRFELPAATGCGSGPWLFSGAATLLER